MQQIQRQDNNIKMLGIIDQMTRTANDNRNAERAAALQRFERFRSLGDAKMAAEELNRAQGKGWLHKLFSNNYNRPEDFDVAGQGLASQMIGERPEVAEDDKKQVAMQAANQEMERLGGYGTGLLEEVKTGFGPKARALMEKLPRAAYELDGPIDMRPQGEEYTPEKASAAQKRIMKVEQSQEKYDSMKIRNMQSRPLSPDATDQYDFYKQQYDAALASGRQGLIKDAYNDMVHKFKLLDNKWGWNMSAGLKDLRPTFPGGGAGGGKKVLWKERGSEKKQYLPEGQVPKDSENWVPIDSEDSSAMRRDLVKLDEQIAEARAANDDKTVSTLMARRRQIEGKTPETTQNFVARMDNSLINPYLTYGSEPGMDTQNIADNDMPNKNKPTAKPKYKEGYEYEINGQRMLYKNGKLRKL